MSYYVVVLCLFFSSLCGMESKQCQLEFCPTRKAYEPKVLVSNQKDLLHIQYLEAKPCVFCIPTIYHDNYIVDENKELNVRVMMNKFPYGDFDQGVHLLVMPLSHKEHFSDFSYEEMKNHIDMVQYVSARLYNDAYTQEYFINWGALSGQSVPHWHAHLKSYVKPPMSLPQRMECYKNARIRTIEDAYKQVKSLLESQNNLPISSSYPYNELTCNGCVVGKCQNDEKNFVVIRFTYNYVCLSHYPHCPGEISIVPYEHVASMKDLSFAALRENMNIAKVLLPKIKEYAHEYIRECDGGNIFIKSMGNKTPDAKKSTYHIHTLIIPRTKVPFTPGCIVGHSAKLDYDPKHLFEYLKKEYQ